MTSTFVNSRPDPPRCFEHLHAALCCCSSPFLKHRLGAAVSREHLRVEAMPGDAPPSVRVTVVGANPVVLIRHKEVNVTCIEIAAALKYPT